MTPRSPILKSASWIVAILALWVGWPSTSCLCADGGIKLFCTAHQHNPGANPSHEPSKGKGDCCDHKVVAQRAVERGVCYDRSAPAGFQVSGQGCTPLVNALVIAPVLIAKNFDSPDHAAAYHVLPVASVTIPAAQPALLPTACETGPPVDIVTELHRLLI